MKQFSYTATLEVLSIVKFKLQLAEWNWPNELIIKLENEDMNFHMDASENPFLNLLLHFTLSAD